jgi:hypothetical protein
MRLRLRHLLSRAALAAALAACAPQPPAGGSSADSASRVAPGGGTAAAAETDSARFARLEGEARALAKTEGCASDAQCKAAPVGHRACGGPRTYVAYCALTTDSAALFAKLDELARAEEEYQRRNGIASTCEMRLPPAVSLSGGRCVGESGGGGAGDAR